MRARKSGVLLLLAAALAGCRDDTVRLAFRPDVGAVYRYEVRVTSTSEVRLPGEPPEARTEEILLQSEHTVLDAGEDGVRVQVILGDAAGSVRTFIVRFDRAAQLESVESDDADASLGADTGTSEDGGVLGLSEIFPAAAVAPPDRALAPGARWVIDDRVALPGAVGLVKLSGTGRLRELGIEDGVEVARLVTSSVLELSAEQTSSNGELVLLEGEQVTEQRASRDLRDGAVRAASSRTTGRYDVEVQPPVVERRDAVRGTLRVTVTSETTRLD